MTSATSVPSSAAMRSHDGISGLSAVGFAVVIGGMVMGAFAV